MDLTERLMHQESNSSAQRSRDTPVPPAQHPATTEFLNTPYFLNTISPSLNLPMMNLNPNRVVAPQPQPTTRHALDLVNALTQPQLLSNLAFPATLPQQMLPQQYMVQPEQPCVCQPTSTRQNPSSSSSLPLNRHRKRPHREESSDSSRPKYSRNGALEPVRSVPVNVRVSGFDFLVLCLEKIRIESRNYAISFFYFEKNFLMQIFYYGILHREKIFSKK